MIVMIRVDDRLIHGQVVLGWTKELHTPGILVIDDAAATTDKVVASTLHMAVDSVHGGLKLIIKTNEDAVKFCQDPRIDDMRIFVVTRKIVNAWNLVKNCPGKVESVDCANYGRWDLDDVTEKYPLPGGFVSPQDGSLDALKELVKVGIPVFHQIIPTDVKEDMGAALKSAGLA